MSRLGRFDKTINHDAVIYKRFSDKGQNPRSIEQQRREIIDAMRRNGLNWNIVKEYSDEAKSGKTERKRPGFQQMKADLFSGRVRASVILVDEIRRFARSDDCADLRRTFMRRGILVLSAERNFVDPTSTTGTLVTAVENIQGSAENAAKADMVRRGQRDRVLQGHWASGEAPFGLKRQWVMRPENGVEVRDHTVLIHDPERASITQEMFRIAAASGRAGTFVFKKLRDDERFPKAIRAELSPERIDYILQNPIYIADYIWGRTESAVENDRTVRYPVAEDEQVSSKLDLVPLCSPEDFKVIQQCYASRAKKDAETSQDSLATAIPIKPGVTLINPLAGLVRCASCGRSMGLTAGGPYFAKSGEERRYEKLKCPRAKSGERCDNSTSVPRDWLIEKVFELIRDRLFLSQIDIAPGSSADEIAKLIAAQPEFLGFVEAVRGELERIEEFRPSRADGIRQQLKDAREESDGLFLSLKSPAVRGAARNQLETRFSELSNEIERLESNLHEIDCSKEKLADAADATAIARQLADLGRSIAGKNASLINTLLAQHIVRIDCKVDGSVHVILTKLGALTLESHDRDWMLQLLSGDANDADVQSPLIGRRLTPRNLLNVIDDDQVCDSLNQFATDITRFDGLGDQWCEEVVFEIPVRKSWVEEHAREVAEFRIESGLSMDKTAAHFGKTPPTIRRALEIAREQFGIDAFGKKISRKSLRNWARENAQAVLEFVESRKATLKATAVHFEKSQPTISKALKMARTEREQKEGDTQSPDSEAA